MNVNSLLKNGAIAFAGAFLFSGCLQGDANPYADESSSSAATASSSRGSLPPSAGVARGDGVVPITPGEECTMSSTQAVNVQFINEYPDQALSLYWVDFSCNEVKYGEIQPGATHVQGTFATHPWRLRAGGVLKHEYVATTETQQLVPLP